MRSVHDVTGIVTQILPSLKFVVAFSAYGQSQTGILTGHRIKFIGVYEPPSQTDLDEVTVGSKVRFSCHEFGSKADHEYDWYITSAWFLDHSYVQDMFLGLYNCSGKVQQLANRMGVLSFVDFAGTKHSVLFLASKFYYRGKRLNAKQNLPGLLAEDDCVLFDAVPCIPNENEYQCEWFATYVWTGGPRPHDYESGIIPEEEKCSSQILQEYKTMVVCPRSLFIRSKGRVLKVINSEYGVALMSVKDNRWDTVLFHRSFSYIYKFCLSCQNIEEVFCEGDLVDIVAVPAPKSMITQWVAAQLAITHC